MLIIYSYPHEIVHYLLNIAHHSGLCKQFTILSHNTNITVHYCFMLSSTLL